MDIGIYHSADLDGQCCAAIYKTAKPDAELVGWDYGKPVPWDQITGNNVTLMDLSFQPWATMELLLAEAASVTWIDHHISAIDEWKAHGEPPIHGARTTFKAACELCWEYFYPPLEIPRGVFLLGDYDCWRHSDRSTMEYQMGMRLRNMDPGLNPDCMNEWKLVFEGDTQHLGDVLYNGNIILLYQSQRNAKTASRLCYPVDFAGLRWLAANAGGINSQFFDSVWEEGVYDGKLAFVFTGTKWTVSLYSDTVNCGEIAKSRGGGGHRGAAGFTCETNSQVILDIIASSTAASLPFTRSN